MKKFLLMAVLVIAAIVLGSLLGDACASSEIFNWLAFSKSFSFQPGTIDIVIIAITFGFSFSINAAQLILIFIAIFVFYKVAPKLITN